MATEAPAEPSDSVFLATLKQWQTAERLSQADVARALDWSPSYVSYVWSGYRLLTPEAMAQAIARVSAPWSTRLRVARRAQQDAANTAADRLAGGASGRGPE